MLLVGLVGVAGAQDHLQVARNPFERGVLQAIYAVVPYDRNEFALDFPKETQPVIYADDPNAAAIDCRQSIGFSLISGESEAGALGISLCPEHLAELRHRAPVQRTGLEKTLKLLEKQPGQQPLPPDKLRRFGIFYDRRTLPGGAEQHYVTVLMIGHGVIPVPTLIHLTDRQAVVVQANLRGLCGDDEVPRRPVPFCTDTRGTLGAIAERVAKTFP